jgi:thioredoxin-related protein
MLWTLALAAAVQGAGAAELLMFEDPACPWCRRWHAEIGPGYPRTEEGRLAPLRCIDIRNQGKAGVALKQPVTATPTFVLVKDGREVGRVVGYPGAEFFYGLLGEVLAHLPEASRR